MLDSGFVAMGKRGYLNWMGGVPVLMRLVQRQKRTPLVLPRWTALVQRH